MKDDSRTTAFMMVTALVLALAAMLAGPAGARPADVDGTELSSSRSAAVRPDDRGGLQSVGSIAQPELVVPYLSHGVGVDAADFGGTSKTAEPELVVPYLSGGVGVDESQFSGVKDQSVGDATNRATLQSDDGFNWRDTSIGFGAATAALLLAGMALLATRGRRGGGIATP